MGKVEAIVRGLVPRFGTGPAAGFFDSSGDFEFVTMFSNMRLAVCFNRILGTTDAGGLLATVAVYQKDVLGYDLAKADAAGDTLYVLQGRDENGMRTLRPSGATVRLGTDSPVLLHPDCEELLRELRADPRPTGDVIGRYCIRDGGRGFRTSYGGYHTLR